MARRTGATIEAVPDDEMGTLNPYTLAVVKIVSKLAYISCQTRCSS